MRSLADALPVLAAPTLPIEDTGESAITPRPFDPARLAHAIRARQDEKRHRPVPSPTDGTPEKAIDPDEAAASTHSFAPAEGDAETPSPGEEATVPPTTAPVFEASGTLKRRLQQIRERSVLVPRGASETAARPDSAKDGRRAASVKQTIPSIDPPSETEGDRVAKAVAEALAKAKVEHEAAIAAVKEEAEASATARVATAREEWVSQEGDVLRARLEDAVAHLKDRFDDAVGRALSPVVTNAVRSRAVERFAEVLHRMLAGGDASGVSVHGPQDLLDSLRARLGETITVEFVPADTVDISARVGDTSVRTALAAWAADIDPAETEIAEADT